MNTGSRWLMVCGVMMGLAMAVGARALHAQQRQGTIVITVVDSVVHPIAQADVEVATADSGNKTVVRRKGRTNDAGIVVLTEIPEGTYVVAARKVTYRPAQQNDLAVSASDTAHVMLMLPMASVTLEDVKIKGTKGSPQAKKVLTADEINPDYVWSARDALKRYRPGMFTDPCVTAMGPMKIYVNGVRRDFAFGRDVLEDIRAEDVQEMRYVGCNDRTMPANMLHALFVILKPKELTKKQKRALQELMRDTTTKQDTTVKQDATHATSDSTSSPVPTTSPR